MSYIVDENVENSLILAWIRWPPVPLAWMLAASLTLMLSLSAMPHASSKIPHWTSYLYSYASFPVCTMSSPGCASTQTDRGKRASFGTLSARPYANDVSRANGATTSLT